MGGTLPDNLFSKAFLDASAPGAVLPELVEVLALAPPVRIERIVSRGHASPTGFWYDQDEREWVALLAGAARLRLEDPDETLELTPGDHVLIEPHRKHRVEWTQPDVETVWLAVFW